MIDPLVGHLTLSELSKDELSEYMSLLSQELALNPRKRFGRILGDPDRKLYLARETILAYIEDDNKLSLASNIDSQTELANSLVDITLSRFHLQRYPGSSQHTIQLNLSVNHRVDVTTNEMSHIRDQNILYGYVTDAVDGQAVPGSGTAVFRGLRITDEFQINVASIKLSDRKDEAILEAMQSEPMKQGITLLSTHNPVFHMITQYVEAATRLFLSRNRNRAIYRTSLGLITNARRTDPKLREGAYLLVQADASWLSLEHFQWSPDRGFIEHKLLKHELPFNYMIFTIRRSNLTAA